IFEGDIPRDDTYELWLSFWDAYVGLDYRIRAGKSRLLSRLRAQERFARLDTRTIAVTPIFTAKIKRPSLQIEAFDNKTYLKLRNRARFVNRHIPKQNRSQRPVWLIGEQPYKAQDTGLAFFRYMRRQHPEIDAYYVIDPNANDKRNLKDLDHVVAFRSEKHVELIFSASVVLGSHHPQYVYPSRSRLMTKSVNPVAVFLQHGIMGMRRMDHMYGREAPDFHVDLFLVSSEREKSFLISDFGYRPEEIGLTGLSRFDSLFETTGSTNVNRILVAPTWREGLQTEEKFLGSEYYARWREFINAEYLEDLVRRYDAEIIFHIHPNMRHFVEHFESPHVF